ncbi:NAD(P)/FAD-dependent oxidoreductase, partial [Clostridium perfringens]|uniref:NAD(P)/FAD-dependent oxidoreductase n=1 Tax=Clostridium perfringens TaxID=1502 RepID=UPI002ACD3A65
VGGAGIAGLLTAYMLKKRGVDVVVIERDRILNGNTLNTTAKITMQHDIIYSKLIKEFGQKNARDYAVANQLAIKTYKDIINENKIDCNFEEKDAYIYTLNNPKGIIDEYDAAKKLGIDAELVDE